MRDLCLGIADLTIAVESIDDDLDLSPPPAARKFLVRDGSPDLTIRAGWGDEPDPCGEKVFDSGGLWSLFREGASLRYQFASPALGDRPYKVARFPSDFSAGEVRLRRLAPGVREADPLEYPLDELVVTNLLARGRGAEIHAAGIADGGRGFLFVGPSGAGKSTMTRLWMEKGARVLSDDRIVLRGDGGRIRMHGTPWHGEAGLSLPESAPLTAVFFLKKAQEDTLLPARDAEATSRLFAASFPPFHDREGLDFTVQFLGGVARSAPCFVLGFAPGERAVDLIRERF